MEILQIRCKTEISAAEHSRFPLGIEQGFSAETFNGSAAIYQLASNLNLGQGSIVLMPAYCCGSEQEPLMMLGCSIRYYGLNNELQIEPDEIEAMLDDSISLVYITHFYGFAQKSIEKICEICASRKIPVLEDCALALYSSLNGKPCGSFGDYAIFSQRKSLGLTEGGMLVSNRKRLPQSMHELKRPPRIPQLDRLLNLQIKALNENLDGKRASLFNRLSLATLLPFSLAVKLLRVIGQKLFSDWQNPEIEGPLALPVYGYSMSRRMQTLFHATSATQIRQRRRDNYQVWLDAMSKIPACTPLYKELPDGCSPLYMPVMCNDRERAMAYFEERDIEASPWWYDEREDIDWEQHANLLPIKRNVLVLPLHHLIDPEDLRQRLSG